MWLQYSTYAYLIEDIIYSFHFLAAEIVRLQQT